MEPQGEPIAIPRFPAETEWINADFVELGTLLGRHVVLVWFWDYTSLNSLRALPYLLEWHRRYGDKGLKVIAVHSPQFEFGNKLESVTAAVERLGIKFPVAHDADFQIWKTYGTEVWPSLYLWNRAGVLRLGQFGEGEYEKTERTISELLLEIDPDLELPEPVNPLRDTDVPGAKVLPPTPHQYMNERRSPKAVEANDELTVGYSGASAWAILDGRGRVDLVIDDEPVRTLELEGPRLYELVDSGSHEQHEIKLRFRNKALAYGFSFGPAPA